MDTGLLLLRLIFGALVFAHGAQKGFGAFGGLGPNGTAPLFDAWGFRPAKTMVLLAATCEIVAGAMIVLGLGTPLAAAMAIGTLTVAGSVNAGNGLWAVKGGYELPLLYVVIGTSLAFTGPGAYSLDELIGLTSHYGVVSGAAALALGLAAALVPISTARRARSRQPVAA